MEKNNGKTVALIALFIAVIGLSIGFAALNTQLNINGSAKVQTSSWDVHFENLSGPTGTAQPTIGTPAPTLTATTFGDFELTFRSPGESISYTWDINNAGSYNAILSTLTETALSCTSDYTNADDAEDQAAVRASDEANVCNNIEYTLKYNDAQNAKNGQAVAQGDTLAANTKTTVTLTVTYKSTVTADLLPKGNVTISGFNKTLLYAAN